MTQTSKPHDNTESLYRVSLKCLIRNKAGDVLVVKEAGRDSWDLPGGGMDYNESIVSAIARELNEEVGFEGDFAYKIISLDEPAKLKTRDIWQIRIIFEVTPTNMTFIIGNDSDKTAFIAPDYFRHSPSEIERKIYEFATAADDKLYGRGAGPSSIAL